jgi:hypothetical protein
MNTQANAVKAVEKEVNYSEAQVQTLRDNAPLNMDKAKALGEKMNKSFRSIIAKAKREGIAYESQPAPTKKAKDAPTKAQLVDAMRIVSGLKLTDLDKAPTSALNELAHYISGLLEKIGTKIAE